MLSVDCGNRQPPSYQILGARYRRFSHCEGTASLRETPDDTFSSLGVNWDRDWIYGEF
jgi:hypothetical protein